MNFVDLQVMMLFGAAVISCGGYADQQTPLVHVWCDKVYERVEKL